MRRESTCFSFAGLSNLYYTPNFSSVTVSATPGAIVLLSPGDGDVLTSDTPPTFEWASERYTLFKLQFSHAAGKGLAAGWTTDISFTPSAEEWRKFTSRVKQGQKVYWNVQGRIGKKGKRTLTETRSFTISQPENKKYRKHPRRKQAESERTQGP